MTQSVEVSFEEESEDALRIKHVFGVEGDAFTQCMKALSSAAFEEYRLELSGLRSISTIREQRELRLYLLYKHLGLGNLTDVQVGELFQMTRTQVGTLIAGTWARFRSELQQQLRDEVEAKLKAGRWIEDDQRLRVGLPDSLARYVKDAVRQTGAPPVENVREVSQTYDLLRQTVEELCARLEISSEGILPGDDPTG